MFRCKHDWQIDEWSNVLQQDSMGYPLRLCITKCAKCGKYDQAWIDVNVKCLEGIETGRFVLCKWEGKHG